MPSAFYPAYVQGELHPESEAILTQSVAGDGIPLHAMSPAEARRAFLVSEWLGKPRKEIAICRSSVGEVPVRIYSPSGEDGKPILIFFHGGGFVLGSLDEFEPFCTAIASDAGCIVVSVDYRLAPEFPFPAALDDAWACTKWVASHARSFGGDPARIAVAGDSAGGNLAAAVAMLGRDQGSPNLLHQILICPWVDLTMGAQETDSFRHFGQGPWLSIAGIEWFQHHYLTNLDQAADPRVSPLRANDFHGLPPALVITAEYDVLADQGRSYAECLQGAGVSVVHHCYSGMLHDFVILPGLFTLSLEALEKITETLREAFSRV